jgi:hypothetical protein
VTDQSSAETPPRSVPTTARSGSPVRAVGFGRYGVTLHQPWRLFRVLGDVVLAVLAVLAAVWFWQRGVVVIHYPASDGLPATDSSRYLGNWLTGAVGLGAVAGLFVVDALRQLVLGLRGTGAPGR